MNIGIMLISYSFTMAEYLCLSKSLKYKLKNYYFIAGGLVALLLFGMMFSSRVGTGYEGYISIRFAFVLLVLFIDGKTILARFERAFLIAIIKDCVLVAIEVWSKEWLVDNVGTKLLDTFVYFSAELLTIALFSCVLHWIIKSFDKDKILKAGNALDYIIVLGSFDIFECIWLGYSEIIEGGCIKFSDRAVISFGAIALLLLEITIVYKKWLAEQVKIHAKAESELRRVQGYYYKTLLDKEEDTKKCRHDMNNHMICIKDLLSEENYDELKEYIDRLYDQTSELVNRSYQTGNSVLDALTNYYADNLEEDIDFRVQGKILKNMNIDNVALSSVYSNMLLNAIEAQRYVEDHNKYIHVLLKEGGKFAQIEVSNSMAGEQIDDVEMLATTKTNKDNHGFGIGNIRKNVSDNDGKLFIEAKDHEFNVKVALPLLV